MDWCPQAVELLTPPSKSTHITQKTICVRARNGLIRSRAEQLQADQSILKTHTVPAEFWWAEGELHFDKIGGRVILILG